jgi:S1-C subfamily serine protease
VSRGSAALLAVALVSLVIGPAQPTPNRAPRPPAFWPPPVLSRERATAETVRVDSRGGGVFDTGTGVGVGAHVALTNAHLTSNSVTLVTRCGEQLLAVDRIERAVGGADVAVVVTTGRNLLPVELAPDDPVPGDRVLLAGYPDGQFSLTEGRVEGTLDRPEGRVLRFSPEPTVGQSGSPLLDAEGRLAGLAFARDSSGGQGLAIPASRLRTLLDEFRARGIPIADAGSGDPASAAARSPACP